MGYRILLVACALVLLGGCAAFDDGNTPYEGWSDADIAAIPGKTASLYSGYYSGNMTVDSNSCSSVSDEAGAKAPVSFDVIQSDTTINVLFSDAAKTTVAGTLNKETTTVMTEIQGVRHVYYLTFADGGITGSVEVLEMDAAGQFGNRCATYTLNMKKGEKPAKK